MDYDERWQAAQAALQANRVDEAHALLEACADERPNDVEPAYQLGRLCAQRHRWDDAERWLKEARLLDEDRADVHYLLGGVYGSTDQLELAESELQRAVDLQPGWPPAVRALTAVQRLRQPPPVTAAPPPVPVVDDWFQVDDDEPEPDAAATLDEADDGGLAAGAGGSERSSDRFSLETPWERGGPLPAMGPTGAEDIVARIERDRTVWLRLRHCTVASALELVLIPFCLVNVPFAALTLMIVGSARHSFLIGSIAMLGELIGGAALVGACVALGVSVHNLVAQRCGGVRLLINVDGNWHTVYHIGPVSFAVHMTVVNVVLLLVNLLLSMAFSGSVAAGVSEVVPVLKEAPWLGLLLMAPLYFAYSLLLACVYNLAAALTGGMLYETTCTPTSLRLQRFELIPTALTASLVGVLFALPYAVIWVGLALFRYDSLGLTIHAFAWMCLLIWLGNALWIGCYNLVANWNVGSGLALTFEDDGD